MASNTSRNAAPMKPYIGKLAYDVNAVLELIKGRTETLDIWVDQESYDANQVGEVSKEEAVAARESGGASKVTKLKNSHE